MFFPSFVTGGATFRFLGALCVAGFLAASVIPALAACDKNQKCDDVSAWAAFTKITLTQSAAGADGSIEWRGSFDYKVNDISIDVETHGTKEMMTGNVGLIGGRIMVTKGLKLHPGQEIDALDGPVLSMKLALILLDRVFPNGPSQITGQMDIDQTGTEGIEYGTGSAGGSIPAPWHVKGKVSKLPDGRLPFELVLSFSTQQQGEQSLAMTMKGELAVLDGPVFREDASLEGSTLYGLGPQVIKQGDSTIVDYGAKPQEEMRYKTIRDVRDFIAAQNDPGVRDASKDFTGFWKNKCEQQFGLQIKHAGNEGKYSVVFCGPGGCGDPSEARFTFITGDKSYEVVSEDEFIEIDSSGDRDTYHRCTRDTNPVLK
ncbi:MAG: hypothetical protein FWD68_21055 [Alphaproteobacteria bacterium]|nr:hypothetical protein [Alphaproteobacteria bacterium]